MTELDNKPRKRYLICNFQPVSTIQELIVTTLMMHAVRPKAPPGKGLDSNNSSFQRDLAGKEY